MIIVTGGEGFIGKNLVKTLLRRGFFNIVSLDIKNRKFSDIYFWLEKNAEDIEVIFHLGAITDTKETDIMNLTNHNIIPSIFIWNLCSQFGITLIYASSAATYGDGSEGFDDNIDVFKLKPLNLYGESKQRLDEWAVTSRFPPPEWYGLKFFNVYGYGEKHKGDMASVVLHFYNQIKETGGVKLFKSHRDNILDGEQKRDFVYVDDVVDVCIHMMVKTPPSGIYNLGTGKARSYNDVAKAVFKSLGKKENISYIDTPINIRSNYQYFTEANILKLRNLYLGNYKKPFHTLEEGVQKYIKLLEDENC